jgi:hypothetical protein
MKRLLKLAVVGLLVVSAGCYHATMIETGLTPSAQVEEKDFAAGWLFGLVGPNIETEQVPARVREGRDGSQLRKPARGMAHR